MDYIVHGILQSRILEWVAFPFSGGIFPGLLHCRQILYQLSHKGSPRILEWVHYPFSSGSSWPRNQTRSPALQADSLPTELSGKPRCQVCCRTEQIRNMPFRAKLFRYSLKKNSYKIILYSPIWIWNISINCWFKYFLNMFLHICRSVFWKDVKPRRTQ